jgi:hypothetical protein
LNCFFVKDADFFSPSFMTDDPKSTAASDARPKLWKTALLLACSAAFGGLAVALWNRGELTQMQNQRSHSKPEEAAVQRSEQTDEEIF